MVQRRSTDVRVRLWQIIIQRSGEGWSGQVLQPLLGQGVLESRVGGTNNIGLIAITPHELLASERLIACAGGKVGIVIRVSLCGCRIVNGNELPTAVNPIGEIPLPFLHRWNAEHRGEVGAANVPLVKVDKEKGLSAIHILGILTGPPMFPPNSFSMSTGLDGLSNCRALRAVLRRYSNSVP